MNGNRVMYFDSIRVEYVIKEIRKFIGKRIIKTNIYRIQAYNLIMCGYVCVLFIDYMLKGKSLLDHTNLYSTNNCQEMIR